MKPLKHQERFGNNYTGLRILGHEGGTGKTVCACLWLKDGRDADALVISPKRTLVKWRQALSDWGTNATVVSNEQFKKLEQKEWSAVVVDEADYFGSPLFIARLRSQLSFALYNLVRAYPEMPTLLLSGTPVRSSPWNLHSLLCYVGIYIDWKKWQAEFFELKNLPYLPRPAYIPKPDWRRRIRTYIEKHVDIVLMKDCVDELPPVTQQFIEVETPEFVPTPETKVFFDEHRWEQQNKVKHILEIGREYRKVFVVAYYREQIEELAAALGKDREVFTVHGGTLDAEAVLTAAKESPECFLICQASIGAGFDASQFSCAVFTSMSYAVRDYIQMTWRLRRVNDLHPIVHYHLMGGRCDRAVWKNIEAGKEFSPSLWSQTLL